VEDFDRACQANIGGGLRLRSTKYGGTASSTPSSYTAIIIKGNELSFNPRKTLVEPQKHSMGFSIVMQAGRPHQDLLERNAKLAFDPL
jgi:hypothetical protein